MALVSQRLASKNPSRVAIPQADTLLLSKIGKIFHLALSVDLY